MAPHCPVKDTADAEEDSTLPTLQRLLEKMETQAGRVLANETYCAVEQGGFRALDRVGRERLREVCKQFHAQCKQTTAGQEEQQLLSRVQAIVTGEAGSGTIEAEPESAVDGSGLSSDTRHQSEDAVGDAQPVAAAQPTPLQRPAQLRVPTTRRAYSWWDSQYWTVARPTDFCYGIARGGSPISRTPCR